MKHRWRYTYFIGDTEYVSAGHHSYAEAVADALHTGREHTNPQEYARDSERSILRRFRDAGLNMVQAEALTVASEPGNLSLAQLARTLGVSSATMTTVAGDLARKGYARRMRSQVNKKVIYIDVLPAGRALVTP